MQIARYLAPAFVLALLPAARPGDPADADPPSRVGRVSFLSGSVSFRPASVDDWAAATVNYPLTTGDHLWTETDARAEITIGSTAVRLAPQSAFAFLVLDDRTTQIRLSQGMLNVRLRHLDDDEVFEIDTPNGAVSLLRPGTYRVDVDSTGDTTTVTVRHGAAEVTAAGSVFPVKTEESAVVSGTDSPSYDIHDALHRDDWEDWCAARDRRRDDARSARYLPRETIGYEDLDDYGEWRETGPYGPVWVPHTVVVDWAPYRYGHWAWVDPWGWTWIDDAPWGFAPFHYGRWAWVDGGWAWVPGRVVAVRPVYAPALVVFVGGPHWSLAITAGGGGGGSGVAWFPLAPDEPYVPAYHVSNTYVRNVNVTNVNVTNINVTNINVTNINYRNRDVPGGVTGVTRETFVAARPVGRSAVIVTRERLTGATVVGSAAPLAPTRLSVLAQPANAAARRPPGVVTTRTVVVRRTPPPPPVPFAAREHALGAQPGRPLDDAALASLRARTPAARANGYVRPAVPAATARGPAATLRPAREGVPPSRPVRPNAPAPRFEKRPPASPERPGRTQRPAPAEAPAERPGRERRAPGAAPAPAPGARPEPAERRAPPEPRGREPTERPQPQGERRPAAERRPGKERKVEKDSVKERKPQEGKPDPRE